MQLIRLRIRTGGGVMWTRSSAFGIHKIREISRLNNTKRTVPSGLFRTAGNNPLTQVNKFQFMTARILLWMILPLFARVPVAARSKVWVCGRSLAGIAGSNPAGAWMSVFCECCVLSGRGLCVGLITRPEEPYRLSVRLSVCNLETSTLRRPGPELDYCATGNEKSFSVTSPCTAQFPYLDTWKVFNLLRRSVSALCKDWVRTAL
jgi:hypothetical protein